MYGRLSRDDLRRIRVDAVSVLGSFHGRFRPVFSTELLSASSGGRIPKQSPARSLTYRHNDGYRDFIACESQDCGTSGSKASDRYPKARQSKLVICPSKMRYFFPCCKRDNGPKNESASVSSLKRVACWGWLTSADTVCCVDAMIFGISVPAANCD